MTKTYQIYSYNMRKFSELPHHLIGAEKVQDLCDKILFNYLWLHAKISSGPISFVLEDFQKAIQFLQDFTIRRQVFIISDLNE